MSNIALRADSLGKRYQIGKASQRHNSIREAVADAAKEPFRKLRKWRRVSEGAEPAVEPTDVVWALRNVSFEVREGEILGLIGHNGAGKSTALKILSRITEPTTGFAEVHGRVGSLLEVGTGFHPELTGRENVYLNGSILGMDRRYIDRSFDEIVEFSGVGKFIDTPVKRYSSGMYLRLAFAVAAHLEPDVLIVDEVLAVGDAAFQRKCLRRMGDVVKEGRTVLFVSHNMGAVRSLCSRTLWLQDGQVATIGPTHDVVDRYLRALSSAAGTAKDLFDIPREHGLGRDLRLRRIQFNEGMPILHGEPLRVRIEYETRADLEGVTVGFGLSYLDGLRLMTVDSDLLGTRMDLPGDTEGTIEVVLDQLMLEPGCYALDVGARSGDVSALDYLPGCELVEVLPGPTTPGAIVNTNNGGVRIPARWEWLDEAYAMPLTLNG